MARGRVGSLSLKTYFPDTGDQMEDPKGGVVWSCVRSNTFTDSSGEKILYGLLMGKTSDDEVVYEPISSLDKKWLHGVQTIRREIVEGAWRVYNWSEETGTWRQLRE
jgi:hypothetical protein